MFYHFKYSAHCVVLSYEIVCSAITICMKRIILKIACVNPFGVIVYVCIMYVNNLCTYLV